MILRKKYFHTSELTCILAKNHRNLIMRVDAIICKLIKVG
jgi:hypothetical protein